MRKKLTIKEVRKAILEKLSPESNAPETDVLEVKEALEIMKQAQTVQRERIEQFIRPRAYHRFS